MKSLLITTGIFAPDIGGPASYARALATRLSEQGVRVTVLTYSSVVKNPGDGSLPFTVRRVFIRLPWGLRHALFFFQTFRLARKHDGILVLNAVSAGVPTAIAARLAHRSFIVRVVGDYAWEIATQIGKTYLLIDEFQKSPKSGRIARLDRMQRWVCRRAKAIIVPSQYLRGLVTAWGISEDKINVIYNGVDFKPSGLTKEEARKKIGISGNLIISYGRLVPWKGNLMLLKIMQQLLQVNQFFRLVIVGDGPDFKTLQSVARNLGLERKVFLVGRKSSADVALYLAASDIFVQNTGYEGFSHQVLEAMKAGVPVITTSVGGNREIIRQGENGLLVRYNDEFNLVEAIKTVWRQQDLRDQIVANGRITADVFSVGRMFGETAELLNSIFT